MMVTALSPYIGYDNAAKIAKWRCRKKLLCDRQLLNLDFFHRKNMTS